MVVIIKSRQRPTERKLVWHVPLVVRTPAPAPKITDQDVAEVVNEMADKYSLHPDLILGKRRDYHIIIARHAFIAEFMRRHQLSLAHAARVLKLDRDTIRNALKKNLKREVEADLELRGYL